MATNFVWGINTLERETDDGYVFTAHYTVDAKSDDAVYSAGAYGSIGLERPEGNLIPYSELTEDVVVAWVLQKLTAEKVAEIEAALDSQIDEQRQPTKQAGVPWGN